MRFFALSSLLFLKSNALRSASFLVSGRQRPREYSLAASSEGGRAEWSDDGVPEAGKAQQPVKFEPRLLDALDVTVGDFLTTQAVETTSRYMLEFHNDIEHRWMTNFCNYSAHGFTAAGKKDGNGRWTDWIEEMIIADTTVLQVLMNPPKAILRGRSVKSDNRVRLEYMHELEPRKIAHQLLTVRESISEEMIQDLGCVKGENVEAMRYARHRLEAGPEQAEKDRKVTRMSESQFESTPLRDRSYLECDIIVTNFALEHVKTDLQKRRNELGVKFLDDVLEGVQKRDMSRSVLERVLAEFYAPRELIEEVCLKGLQDGVDKSSGVNTLSIAESLLQARYALSLEVNRILLEQGRFARSYYKMIKDRGGFQTWRAKEERAQVRVVDLNVEDTLEKRREAARALAKEEAAAAEKAREARAKAEAEAAQAREAAEAEEAAAAAAAASLNGFDNNEDLGPESFGSQGPVFM